MAMIEKYGLYLVAFIVAILTLPMGLIVSSAALTITWCCAILQEQRYAEQHE